jgi:hypothetical protein
VYALLLCSFDITTPELISQASIVTVVRAIHSVDTAILRANTQTYREAYDVMVKINRFVRVSSTGGLPLRSMVMSRRVPVVALGAERIGLFQG